MPLARGCPKIRQHGIVFSNTIDSLDSFSAAKSTEQMELHAGHIASTCDMNEISSLTRRKSPVRKSVSVLRNPGTSQSIIFELRIRVASTSIRGVVTI